MQTINSIFIIALSIYISSLSWCSSQSYHITRMCDPNNPNRTNRTTPQWALYRREAFWGPNEAKYPLFNTYPAEVERLAKEKLSEGGWYYSSCNAGLSWTHLANRQAFYRHRIIPRMLVDTNVRDTATAIFGHKVSAPIGFAPIGIPFLSHFYRYQPH
jgi:hypothetical protein